MSKRTRWSVAISLAVVGVTFLWFYVYFNRTGHCFKVEAETWNQACADHAEVLAQQGDERAMAGLSIAYSNLNDRDRGFYWLRMLAERGDFYAILQSAYMCPRHPSVTRPSVLRLIDRHVSNPAQKSEVMGMLNKYCPQTASIVD